MSKKFYTVKSLISALAALPSNARVCVDGYEDGIDDIGLIYSCNLALDVNTVDWSGTHELVPDNNKKKYGTAKVVKAIVLSRYNKEE